MRSSRGLKTVPKLVFAFILVAMMISAAYAQPPTLLFEDSVPVNEIAVSKYGQYAASVGGNEVRFYDRTHQMWFWHTGGEVLYSVAISADGNSVVAGGATHVFFWKNAISRSLDTAPTWTSVSIGRIDERCLDISDDGAYVLAGSKGYGSSGVVLYWAGVGSKSGNDVGYTWSYPGGGGPTVEAVDLSDNGDYAAVGFSGANVGYWKNARTRLGDQAPDWMSTEAQDVTDVAVSRDGNFVAASGMLGGGAVYYWAGATSLAGDPPTSWNADFAPTVEFLSVDMSHDGDSVVAGAEDDMVYFWSGCRTLTGKPQAATWTYLTSGDVADVVINGVGTYMAAAALGNVYFLDNTGGMKWSTPYALDDMATSMSISYDGRTLAAGSFTSSVYLLSTGFPTAVRGPVGGVVESVNKLAVAAPYLVLFGLVTTIVVVAVAPWKKPES